MRDRRSPRRLQLALPRAWRCSHRGATNRPCRTTDSVLQSNTLSAPMRGEHPEPRLSRLAAHPASSRTHEATGSHTPPVSEHRIKSQAQHRTHQMATVTSAPGVACGKDVSLCPPLRDKSVPQRLCGQVCGYGYPSVKILTLNEDSSTCRADSARWPQIQRSDDSSAHMSASMPARGSSDRADGPTVQACRLLLSIRSSAFMVAAC